MGSSVMGFFWTVALFWGLVGPAWGAESQCETRLAELRRPPSESAAALAASRELFELLDSCPERVTEVQLQLASSLQSLGLLHSSRLYFVEVLESGGPPAAAAVRGLVEIAATTRDDTEVIRLLDQISLDAVSGRAGSYLYFARALRAYERGEFGSARNSLSKIESRRGELNVRGLYVGALVALQQGKLRTAVKNSRPVGPHRRGAALDRTAAPAMEGHGGGRTESTIEGRPSARSARCGGAATGRP